MAVSELPRSKSWRIRVLLELWSCADQVTLVRAEPAVERIARAARCQARASLAMPTGAPRLVEPVRLERLALRHAQQFLRAVRSSRDLHRRWVSPPADLSKFAQHVKSLRSANREGFVVVAGREDIVGAINVNEIVRGSFQSAYLGYYAFEPFAGRGFMRAGMRLAISRCFGELSLHRLEANIQPDNARSIALVKSLGFHLEGLSPRYLKIGGRWRDHERWALLSDNWRGTPLS